MIFQLGLNNSRSHLPVSFSGIFLPPKYFPPPGNSVRNRGEFGLAGHCSDHLCCCSACLHMWWPQRTNSVGWWEVGGVVVLPVKSLHCQHQPSTPVSDNLLALLGKIVSKRQKFSSESIPSTTALRDNSYDVGGCHVVICHDKTSPPVSLQHWQ